MTPNILTILRIFSAPILVIVLSFQNFNMVVLGLSIFIISSFTDFLDSNKIVSNFFIVIIR